MFSCWEFLASSHFHFICFSEVEGSYDRQVAWTRPCTHMGMRSHLWLFTGRKWDMVAAREAGVTNGTIPPSFRFPYWWWWWFSHTVKSTGPMFLTHHGYIQHCGPGWRFLWPVIILNFLDLLGQGSQLIIRPWHLIHLVMRFQFTLWRIVKNDWCISVFTQI